MGIRWVAFAVVLAVASSWSQAQQHRGNGANPARGFLSPIPVPAVQLRPGLIAVEVLQDQHPQLRDPSAPVHVAAYAARLERYLTARLEWELDVAGVDRFLLLRIPQVVGAEVPVAIDRYLQGERIWWRMSPVGEECPLLFTLEQGFAHQAGDLMHKNLPLDVLPRPQRKIVDDALALREERRRTATATYVISKLDEELWLTEIQQSALSKEWTKRAVSDPLVGFERRQAIIHQGTLTSRQRELDPVLAPQQAELFRLLVADASSQVIETDAANLGELLEGVQLQIRQVALCSMNVRIAALESAGIADEPLRRLRSAANGSALLWSRTQMDSGRPARLLRQRDSGVVFIFPDENRVDALPRELTRGLVFSAPVPRESHLAGLDLWQHAFESAAASLPVDPVKEHWDRINAARAEMVLEILDSELWLRAPQRDALSPLIARNLAGLRSWRPDENFTPEFVWLALALNGVTDDELGGILADAQLKIWNSLRSYFLANRENTQWSVPLGVNGNVYLRLE